MNAGFLNHQQYHQLVKLVTSWFTSFYWSAVGAGRILLDSWGHILLDSWRSLPSYISGWLNWTMFAIEFWDINHFFHWTESIVNSDRLTNTGIIKHPHFSKNFLLNSHSYNLSTKVSLSTLNSDKGLMIKPVSKKLLKAGVLSKVAESNKNTNGSVHLSVGLAMAFGMQWLAFGEGLWCGDAWLSKETRNNFWWVTGILAEENIQYSTTLFSV